MEKKTLFDILKMVISTVFGFVFSLILMGAGVLNKKADISYVEKEISQVYATTNKLDDKINDKFNTILLFQEKQDKWMERLEKKIDNIKD